MECLEAIQQLNEVRKEDDLYFNGCFWIIADSFKDILLGNFKIEGIKYLVNDNGDEISKMIRKNKIHQNIWNQELKSKYNNREYTFYPRGRVSHYQGVTYININPKINLPGVIDSIFDFYDLNKLNRATDIILKEENGEHYKFELR